MCGNGIESRQIVINSSTFKEVIMYCTSHKSLSLDGAFVWLVQSCLNSNGNKGYYVEIEPATELMQFVIDVCKVRDVSSIIQDGLVAAYNYLSNSDQIQERSRLMLQKDLMFICERYVSSSNGVIRDLVI